MLFDKIEDAPVEAQVNKLYLLKRLMNWQIRNFPAAKPEITFEDFTKMDIRMPNPCS
jgi:hypothetical protein